MIKYIVTYLIIQMVQAECPDANNVDRFGVKQNSSISCGAYHLKGLKTYKEKVFFNKDSAKTFYEEAINHNKKLQGLMNLNNNYKIDSVKFNIVK